MKQKILIGILSLLGGAVVAAQAQKLPLPGRKNPDWVVQELPAAKPKMPMKRAYAVPDNPGKMPGVDIGAWQSDPETGAVVRFYDRNHGIFYDLAAGLMEDRTTGKTYAIHRRDEPAKTARNRVIYL